MSELFLVKILLIFIVGNTMYVTVSVRLTHIVNVIKTRFAKSFVFQNVFAQ